MKIIFLHKAVALVSILIFSLHGVAQISPGELAKVHSHLEGMANCTQCHTLGAKVSNDKCLDCHKEIKKRLELSKGFHASSKIKGKECVTCHSDHYGKNYDIVHLVKDKFDHNDTGYKLEGKHAKKDCKDCHKRENIADEQLKKKQETYLGLNDLCLTCHEDFHQKTLSVNCLNCHIADAFKPASKFDHSKAKYQLIGKHTTVACIKCHLKSVLNSKDFQQFTGLKFQNCVNCHKDPHENKFGQNCVQCHVEESFKTVKSIGRFDHSKTGYILAGRHAQVTCKLCHTISITAPLKHQNCVDCHKDYHNNQFSKGDKKADCSECHDLSGFSQFSFSTEKHNQGKFKLEGAHLATPCFECHKKGKDWNFRGIGEKCVDCHRDIHEGRMEGKNDEHKNCDNCHEVSTWDKITFDHKKTTFPLEGKHIEISCRKCHFKTKSDGTSEQNFKSVDGNCEICHLDVHRSQFHDANKVVCLKCHDFASWKPVRFNHNATRFKLDGGHREVACIRCHKVVEDQTGKYINYKIIDLSCAACHLH